MEKVWYLPCPPKARNKQCLATKKTCFGGSVPVSLCVPFVKEIESIEHILSRCKWTCDVWNTGSLSLSFPFQNVIWSAVMWFNDLVQMLSHSSDVLPRLGLVAHVSWSIWKCRNDLIFSGISPCHRRALCHAFSVNGVFLASTYSGCLL